MSYDPNQLLEQMMRQRAARDGSDGSSSDEETSNSSASNDTAYDPDADGREYRKLRDDDDDLIGSDSSSDADGDADAPDATATDNTYDTTDGVTLPQATAIEDTCAVYDMRGGSLPEGIDVIGDHILDVQDDGSTVLLLGQFGHLRVRLPDHFTGNQKGSRINSYTITMDIRVADIPEHGYSLFQTGFPDYHDSDEAVLSPIGTVGAFSEFGETPMFKVGKWNRVVIAVGGNFEVGEHKQRKMTTYINGRKCVEITEPMWGYGKDTRFSVDPKGFMLFVSHNHLRMPGGVQVKYVRFNCSCDKADKVAKENRIDSVFSQYAANIATASATIKKNLSLAPLMKHPHPIWLDGTFLSAFGDPYLEGTGLGGGGHFQVLQVLQHIMQRMKNEQQEWLQELLHPEHFEALDHTLATMERSLPIFRRYALAQRGPAQLVAFLKFKEKVLSNMKDGDSIYMPGGFTHPKMGTCEMLYELTRVDASKWQMVVVNVGAQGLSYHPADVFSPKIKYKTCVMLDDLDPAKLHDDAWWVHALSIKLFPAKTTSAASLYDHLLPFLTDGTWAHQVDKSQNDPLCPYRTIPRGGPSVYRLLIDAMYYSWLRKAVPVVNAKFILFNIRREFVKLVVHDLSVVKSITDSDRTILKIAGDQLSRRAIKLSSDFNTPIEHLKLTRDDVVQLHELVKSKPSAPSENTTPPAPLDLDPTKDKLTQFHAFPAMERLLRKEDTDGLIGPKVPIPAFVPIDFLQVPEAVNNFEEALTALRYADRLCTLVSVQAHCVKNSRFLKCAMLQHVFTQIVPVPTGPGADRKCIWYDTPMRYGVQLDVLILLQRLMEHFASSALALHSTKSFDAVRIVVTGAMVAIADCVIRKTSTDHPSEVMTTLNKGSFGVGMGKFASQSETIEVTAPEVNVTRTAIMDYFSRCDYKNPIFQWEQSMKPEATLGKYLSDVCAQLAFPDDMITYMCDGHALIIKNYPEFACFRDVAFYWKFFMNTEGFPPAGPYKQRDAELTWGFNQMEGEFVVKALGMQLPTAAGGHRWASGAAPSRYTAPVKIYSEDDLLHIHSFSCFEKTLTQKDVELLLSFLTVPYMRIPLTLNFFATADRINALRDRELRALLDSVVFEPSRYLTIDGNYAPTFVPSEDPALVASPYGVLLNELHRSPRGLIDTMISLVKQARKLDVGTVYSSTVGVILYIIRLVQRVESAMLMLVQIATKTHPSIVTPLRDVELDDNVLTTLVDGLSVFEALLRSGPNSIQAMLETWLMECHLKMEEAANNADDLDEDFDNLTGSDTDSDDDEVDPEEKKRKRIEKKSKKSGGSSKVDKNTKISCRLYAHLVLLHRNLTSEQLNLRTVSTLLSAFQFMQTRHTWNHQLLEIPETEIYEAMEQQRRNIIGWFRNTASNSERNHVLECIVRVTSATGVRIARPGDVVRQWDYITGARSVGRYTLASKTASVITITSLEEFQDALKKHPKVVVDFFATWCGPCQAMAPVYKLMAQQIPAVTFLRVDVDVAADVAAHCQITAMPTFHVYFQGVLRKNIRGADPAALREAVQAVNNIITYSDGTHKDDPNLIADAVGTGKGVDPEDIKEEEINLQTHVLQLKSNHLKALEDHIQADEDVQTVFQTEISMQCAVMETAKHRDWFRLIGRFHDIQYWKTPDPETALQVNDREYEPGCLGRFESWIVPLFEPVRLTYFNDPMNPIEFVMPEKELPPGSDVAYIVALHPKRGGTWKEVFVFKEYSMVQIYDVVSYGRRHYRMLSYTTDARFTLREMQPATADRQQPWPSWCRHGAGDPTADLDPGISAVILREMQAKGNASGTKEQFIPRRFLYGLVPSALVDTHLFWQDDADNIIGYPVNENATHRLYLTFSERRPHSDLPCMPSDCLAQIRRVPVATKESEELPQAAPAARSGTPPPTAVSTTGVEPEVQLVNLLYAKKGSALHSIAKTLARIENLAHILVWTKDKISAEVPPPNDLNIHAIELPRLKLTFAPKRGADGVERLYSVDHVDLFITNERNPLVVNLIRGIPHSLILSTINNEATVLVPSISPVRPFIGSSPFSSELVLDRSNVKWRQNLASPYYLYPVHVSMSFLQTPTLACALYLLLLRFSFRAYEDVVRLVDTVATDTDFQDQPEELQIFKALGRLGRDCHPNAHAARLKVNIVTADSPVTAPWMIDVEMCKLLNKLAHVGSACQLSIHERMTLLDECEALEKKQEIVSKIVEEYGPEEVVKLLGAVLDPEAALEVQFAEKKKIDKFFKTIQDKIYQTIRRRVRQEEVIDIIKRVLQGFRLPEVFVCLWKNNKAFIEAFTNGEKSAKVVLPRPARESGWRTIHLPRALDASTDSWSLLSINDVQSKGVSGHVVVDVIGALHSGATDTCGGKTGFGFLFFYGLMTGTVKFKFGNCSDAHTFAAIGLPLLADYGDNLLASILHIMSWNRDLCKKLPLFKDTRKNKNGPFTCSIEEGDSCSPLEDLLDTLVPRIQRAAATITKPPSAASFKQFPMQRDVVDVPLRDAYRMKGSTNFPFGEFKLPIDSCGYNPVLYNTARERIYLPETEEMRAFATYPLLPIGFDHHVLRCKNEHKIAKELPFDVSEHKNASSHIAVKMLERFSDEMKEFATQHNENNIPKIHGLNDDHSIEETLKNTAPLVAELLQLQQQLAALRDADAKTVQKLIDELSMEANAVPDAVDALRTANGDVVCDDDHDADALSHAQQEARRRFVFELRRQCGLESFVWVEYLVGALISDVENLEYTKLNPFLSADDCEKCREKTVTMLLHANRVGHANRALLEVRDLIRLLRGDCSSEKQLASLIQKSDALAAMLAVKRSYVETDPTTNRLYLDPRFLVFEFTWNLVLRESQVIMVRSFMEELNQGRSSVWQMIMGAGKTTVVGPLLALLLTTGKQLVMQVVPPALLEFSRGVMRSTFSSIIKKRVYTFLYDRSTEVDPMLYRKLYNAQCTAGIVVSNPTSIKSLQLKFIEYLDQIADPTRPRSSELEESAVELGKVLGLFKTGVLMMDEVDLILHPLKSELNFPIGAKEPLDFSPLRWQMPVHILDSVFYASRGRMSVEFRESVLAAKILRRIQTVINQGYACKALQANPHIVLLDAEFYHTQLKPLIAQWTLLWMEQHSFTGISAEDTLRYITTQSVHDEELKNRVNEKCLHRNKQMLNLAHDWLCSYLPHTLMKIDRVTFGIMTKADSRRALELTPNMPRSRMMLAIPFVGKDVPSDASEFAHPDIIIGLTILAYRYEGLRFSDFKEIISSLRETVLKENGPWHERKTNVRYEQWVKEAGGKVRGQVDYRSMTSIVGTGSCEMLDREVSPAPSPRGTDGKKKRKHDDGSVISLKLLKQSSKEQVWELFTLLRKLPDVIHWYLNEFVFPTHMRFQNVKISASGQDLGGDMLFPRRVGFSGTPSDLLPVELGRCHYEAGSDGLVINTLTNPKVVTYDIVEPTWTPHSLLRKIATENRHHALIDTGALITGMSNYDVAKFLLDAGLDGKDGVVFLDESDRKMILVRATGRVLKLEECGIPLDRRFAFYDQIHTTGMDIKHTPNATAVLTLGKDMTFRDYAQGAFRMRGINKGQKIHLFITPEIRELMLRELRAASIQPVEPPQHRSILVESTSWLVINSMGSERLQFNQLCLQNVTNVYRKNGFSNLLKGHKRFKINQDMRNDHCLAPSLDMFHEPVEFNLEAAVPEPRLFSETIESLIEDKKSMFITSKEEIAIVNDVHMKVVGLVENAQERAFNQDMVREQEEEKEKMKEVVEEKELEITQFKDQQYARDQEEPTPWLFMSLSNRSDIDEAEPATFYDADQFRLFARQPIQFPKNMQVSNNYFDRRWSGHRRVKNVIMVMDWIPDRSDLRRCTKPLAGAPAHHTLERTLQLLTENKEVPASPNAIAPHDLQKAALRQLFSTAFEVNVDHTAVDHIVNMVSRSSSLTFKQVEEVMEGPILRQEDEGRVSVCLSLIEAETIRRIMHVKHGEEVIEGSNTDLALRAVCCDNYQMDQSFAYTQPPSYQKNVTWQAFRFLDCETHMKDAHLNFLLKGIQMNAMFERRLFFEQIIGCKRRNQKNWEKTPVSRAFSIESEYVLLHLRMLALRVKELVHEKELLPYDAFQKFDHGRLGSLSPGNIYAAFKWLGLDPTHEDVLDYVAMANPRGEGRVNYSEWLEMMRDATAQQQDQPMATSNDNDGMGMGTAKTSSLDNVMDSPSLHQDQQQSRFAGVIEDRLPPMDEEAFDAILVQRNAQQDELKRVQDERMKQEQKKFTSMMRQYKKDVSKARGTDDNPSIVCGVLRFDFTTGFMPDDVTHTGYTYFEPSLEPGKKQLCCDTESMVVLPLAATYGLDEPWPVDVCREYSISMSITMNCSNFAGPGVPLIQLARHLPGGLVVSVLHDGTVGVPDLKREDIFVDEKGTWQWDGPSGWQDFDKEHQADLERQYRRDPNSSHTIMVFGIGPILVNFSNMTQRNTTNHNVRSVRREQNTSGKRVKPHQLALITVNVCLDSRTISTFVDGEMSTMHVLPDEIPTTAAELDMERQVFLFGHNDKAFMHGGSVKWVSIQPRAVTTVEILQMYQQYRAFSDWACPVCTFVNKDSNVACEVCGSPRQ